MDVMIQAGVARDSALNSLETQYGVHTPWVHAHRSPDSLHLTSDILEWEVEDSTASKADIPGALSDFFRIVAMLESSFRDGTIVWWVVGLNLDSNSKDRLSDEWFASTSAFRMPDGDLIPGFIHFDGFNVSPEPILRITIVSRANPITPEIADMAQTASKLINRW